MQTQYRPLPRMQSRFQPSSEGTFPSQLQGNQGLDYGYPQRQNLNGDGPSRWGN